jgi:hypothetical protein
VFPMVTKLTFRQKAGIVAAETARSFRFIERLAVVCAILGISVVEICTFGLRLSRGYFDTRRIESAIVGPPSGTSLLSSSAAIDVAVNEADAAAVAYELVLVEVAGRRAYPMDASFRTQSRSQRVIVTIGRSDGTLQAPDDRLFTIVLVRCPNDVLRQVRESKSKAIEDALRRKDLVDTAENRLKVGWEGFDASVFEACEQESSTMLQRLA